jgi:hypothetical protein
MAVKLVTLPKREQRVTNFFEELTFSVPLRYDKAKDIPPG